MSLPMALMRCYSADVLAKYCLHATSDSRSRSSFQTSAITPDKGFNFLNLPQEIRDEIYALTLDWIVLSLDGGKPRIANNGLFDACTQIRNEISKVLGEQKELRIAIERCVWAALDCTASLDTLLEKDLPELFDVDRITHLGLTIEVNPYGEHSGQPRLGKLLDMKNLDSVYIHYIYKPHPRTPWMAGIHEHLLGVGVKFSMADFLWTVPRGVKLMWGSALELTGHCSLLPPGLVHKDDFELYSMARQFVDSRPESELSAGRLLNPEKHKYKRRSWYALTAREIRGGRVLS